MMKLLPTKQKDFSACYPQLVDISRNCSKGMAFVSFLLSLLQILEGSCTIPGKCSAGDSACKPSHHMTVHEQTSRHDFQLQQEVKQTHTHTQRDIRSPPTHPHTQRSICLFLCSGLLTSVAAHIHAHTQTPRSYGVASFVEYFQQGHGCVCFLRC